MSSTTARRDSQRAWFGLPDRWHREADVVIVGYGGAGIAAAFGAQDTGASPLVVEKAPFGGGNTGCCGGGMRIPTDVAGAVRFYRGITQGTVDDGTLFELAQAMVALPERLAQWGMELEWFPRSLDLPTLEGSESFLNVASIARTPQEKAQQESVGTVHAAQGRHLFAFLESLARRRGIEVVYEAPAQALVQDPVTKEVLGIRVRPADSATEECIRARHGVVLACGGFQNNREMLVNYLPHFTHLPVYPYGTPYNTGDGIEMAAAAGAKLWHMSGCELATFAPKGPSEAFGVGFRLEKQLPPRGHAIFVNRAGRRFMDESVVLNHRKDAFAVQRFDHDQARYPNIPFFMVFDETVRTRRPIVGTHIGWWKVHGLYEWSSDNSAEVARGWIVKADTFRALARRLDIDADGLEASVARYNELCKRGIDSEFGRPEPWLGPLDTPPYYGTELCEPLINTHGGPKHNVSGQVLDRHDQPIPRLYAAGELGSFFYPLYESASNLPEALALGRIAGEHAASLTPWI